MTELQTRGILTTLTMRAWKATAIDRELAEATEHATQAESGTMRVIKELTPKIFIQPIKTIISIGRTEHYRMTVPGLTRGQHLLASAMFENYIEVQREIRDHFWRRVDQFLEIYPDIIKQAPKRLSNAYKAEDFPSVQKIRTYFEYSFKFVPVPTIQDWRLEGLTPDATNDLRMEAEDEIRAMFNAATREVFERAREVLSRVALSAKEYTGGPGSAQLRDSTIDNLKEMARLVVKMNVTNDKDLAALGYEMIEEFADAQAADLRRNEEARLKIAAAAQRLLNKIPNAV